MATEYPSAASWSKEITVTADGDIVSLIQTIAPKMGVAVDTTTGTITVFTTLGSPDMIKADTATWTAVSLTTGEGTVDMPVSAVKVTGATTATGAVWLIQ
jgi:hypothetical protein